jgi:oligosaccharide repeat unit polymerase
MIINSIFFKAVIIIISLLIVFINRYLTKKIISNNKFLTIFEVFNYYYIFLIFIGSIALNIYQFQYEDYFGFYDRPDILLNIWLLCSSALLLMPMGAVLFNSLVNFHPKKAFKNFNVLFVIQGNKVNYSLKSKLFFLTLLFTTVIVFLLYQNSVGDLAVFHIFQGFSPGELSILRSDATNNFGGKFHRYQLFLITIPNLLLIVAFFLKSKSKIWNLFFYLILSLAVFYSLLNVEKAPVIKIFLLIGLANLFLYPNINFKKIVLLTIGVLAGLILMYIYIMGMDARFLSDILGAIFHRIFIGQVHPLYWWQLYLEQNGTLGFSAMPNPGGIFPFTPVSMTVIIHQFAFPEFESKGIIGSMPTVYFAYWMLSFGYLAAVLSMLFFGFILQFVDFLFSKRLRSNPKIFTVSFYIIMMDFFLRYISDGFEGILFDFNWIFPLLICYIYFFIVKGKKSQQVIINE